MPRFPVKSRSLFLCIGDSITDCGRRGAEAPYGTGYMSLFRELVIARRPELDIRWLNRGIGGNTVLDLYNRWEDDVLAEKPDWLSIKIGINDLHRTLFAGNDPVDPKKFRELYSDILSRTRKRTKAKIVLLDPFYLSTEKGDQGRRAEVLKLLPKYLAVVRDMARKYKTAHIETQKLYEKQMRYRPPQDFAPEPVHPYRLGHLIMAEALYDTVSRM
ncbi:MAG: SGNH/GDSL hydrolase family protein [Planctomycetota bacterium]|nr:SGNH/GDSL hydrolase family protein [Planctomycetota bacterium]